MPAQDAGETVGVAALIYFALWLILGGGGWFYVKTRPTAALKRIWWKRWGIGFTAFVILYMDAMIFLSNGYVPALVMLIVIAPFGALISWLNIRNTNFCDACGKRSRSGNIFGKMTHCSYCGSKFEDAASSTGRPEGATGLQ